MLIPASKCRCFLCEKKLPYGDTCISITVGSIQADGFEPEASIPYESYRPSFAHEDCWEEAEEEALERLNCPDENQEDKALVCCLCKNEIDLADLFAVKQLGFLKVSDFSPNGDLADDFQITREDKDAICLDCLTDLSQEDTDEEEEVDE